MNCVQKNFHILTFILGSPFPTFLQMTEMLFLCVRISRISEAVAKCLIDVDDAAAGNLGIHFLIKSVLPPSLPLPQSAKNQD